MVRWMILSGALALVEGNPLDDMEALGAIRAIYKEGELVDRDALAVFH